MKNKEGYIYVLSNPAMPHLYKVGMSTRGAAARADELFTSGVPFPFKVEFEAMVRDCVDAERHVHQKLYSRVNKNREFFDHDLDFIVNKIIQVVAHQYALFSNLDNKRNSADYLQVIK